MKKYLAGLAFSMILPVAQSHAANVDFNVGVNIGVPVARVHAAAPSVVITSPPDFIAPPELGFYVAVGSTHDLFFHGNTYWLCRGGMWYSATYYNGPWRAVGTRGVPFVLRKYPLKRIHSYRDNYYRRYHGQDNHEYRHFRPGRRDLDSKRHGGGHGNNRDGRSEGHGKWKR